MQQTLFGSIPVTQNPVAIRTKSNRELDDEKYNAYYCKRQILTEEHLWDMRCWQKPKYQYSKQEVIDQIKKSYSDNKEGTWSFNCGHCFYCIERLLTNHWATLDEIVDLVWRNNNITYTDQIGTWGNGFDEE